MFRIGQGFDVHETKTGSEIILGGVSLSAPFALEGFSDADVLLHAITDALLGAIAQNDIGHFFPPHEEKNRNRSSKDFLQFAQNLIEKKGYAIANIDSTIICEQPKINPHREKIQNNIAHLLQLEKEQISVKATTTEKLGFTGRQEGIAAMAIVLLHKKSS